MPRPFFLVCALLLWAGAWARAAEELRGIYNPLHGYFTQEPNDRFSRLMQEVAAGSKTLDTSSELPFLRSLLAALEVPESSQMLVYSVTSLQKALISPRRPRALYFSDDTYVGFVPDGRVEVISADPRLGNNFYIFNRIGGGGVPRFVRSDECVNCHSTAQMGYIPGLVVQSVVPGITGGGERAFRREQSGHGVPLELRFGGWHVTGAGPEFPNRWGNLIIQYRNGTAEEIPNPPGRFCDLARYPRPTSDVLPQLLHEHQVGFVDRVLQATYAATELREEGSAKAAALAELARPVTRYLLFADEAAFPRGSVPGDPDFRRDFAQGSRRAGTGASLRDFDLSTRLFRYRCSYMIYSPAFASMPPDLKAAVLGQMRASLAPGPAAPEYAYLPEAEKRAIGRILGETLPGYAVK
jgi:hypothetical protein